MTRNAKYNNRTCIIAIDDFKCVCKGVPDPEISVLCYRCRINTYIKIGRGLLLQYYAITFLHSLLLLKTVMWHMGATPSPLLYNVPGNDAKYDKIND